MHDLERHVVHAGVVGPLIGFATTLAASALSPTFRWTASALSDLGSAGAANPWLFNGGLVESALVTLPFVWPLWGAADHLVERLGTAAFALSVVLFGLVGVFPTRTALHAPVSIAYFTLLTVTL